MHSSAKHPGKLYIVSVGIGDVNNMTLRARDVIEAADIILSMDFIRENLRSMLDGKQVMHAGHCLFTPMGRHHKDEEALAREEEEKRQCIHLAMEEGKTVAVLDFGDPLLFGPQVGYLTEFARYAPEVIPGVSSVGAAFALFARPLLLSSGMRFMVTTLEGFQAQAAPYPELTAFFMMHTPLEDLVAALISKCGEDMPIALVFHAGFVKKQRIVQSTLSLITAAVGHMEEWPWEYLVFVGSGLEAGRA